MILENQHDRVIFNDEMVKRWAADFEAAMQKGFENGEGDGSALSREQMQEIHTLACGILGTLMMVYVISGLKEYRERLGKDDETAAKLAVAENIGDVLMDRYTKSIINGISNTYNAYVEQIKRGGVTVQ